MTRHHLFIYCNVLMTVYSLLVIKTQMVKLKALPDGALAKAIHLTVFMFTNPWMLSIFVAMGIAALSWMMAMTKFDLSYAYPFTGLNFALVLLLSSLLLGEPMNIYRGLGTLLIIGGVIVASRGL